MSGVWRRFAWRIVGATVLSGLLGMGLLLVMFIPQFIGLPFPHAAHLFIPLSADQIQSCRDDPARWVHRTDGVQMIAYDRDTLRPIPADAPPMDVILMVRRWLGEREPAHFFFYGHWGGVMLLETGLGGDCALVQLWWRSAPEGRRLLGWIMVVVSFSLPIISSLLAMALAIRPLLDRITRLSEAALLVGSDRYRPAEAESDDALGRLSAALTRSHDRQQQARRAIERHLDNIAHDLRTPLAALQLRLENVADQGGANQPALNGGLADVMYLTLLTENLRLAARMRDVYPADDANPTADLTEVMGRIGDRFRLLGRRRDVDVACAVPDAPVWVACPEVFVEQAFANLVHNAIVHNHPGGHVAIILVHDADRFTVSIIDDGPGVDLEDFPELMDRAVPAGTARQRDRRGSGLGLAIAGAVFRRARFTARFTAESPSGLRVDVSGEQCSPAPSVGSLDDA
ncbi:MAG: HAMP domain-containing sensor histidine kinase [Myxococcota bacterium]